MRLLADENFPKPIVEELRAEGHDVLWARTDLAGARDIVLLDLAESEARIVLTLDSQETRTACACVCRRQHHVGRTYQHHYGRRNSDGDGAQKVRRPLR